MTLSWSAPTFSLSAPIRLVRYFKGLLDQTEPPFDMVQPLLNPLEALIHFVKPLVDPIEPLVDLVPPPVAAGQAGSGSPRLLLGGAGLLEGIVDFDQHRAHACQLWLPTAS